MIPNIFVSSTIEDLHHLRDAIRDVILELAYNPVMSEYGDVGYLPTASAEESCYISMRQCQLAVIILGKRYGSLSANEFSISHNEFKTARNHKIPIICMVDQEVWSYKSIFDANKKKKQIDIPGMDAPEKTFSFLQDIIESPLNNGILPFTNVASARNHLKTQLAHIFGDLLNKKFDPIKADIMDVLSEIKTLRHEIKGGDDKEALTFLKGIRVLLNEDNDNYRGIIEQLYETVDQGIPDLIKSKSFTEFIENATGKKPKIVRFDTAQKIEEFLKLRKVRMRYTQTTHAQINSKVAWSGVSFTTQVYLNPIALRDFEKRHDSFRKVIEEKT